MGGVQSTEQTAEGEWQEGLDEQLTRRGTETTPPKVGPSIELQISTTLLGLEMSNFQLKLRLFWLQI